MSYKESSVLITGASQGIGRNIAITFAALTNRPLILIARNRENLDETKRLCEHAGAERVAVVACNLASENDVMNIEIPERIPGPGIIVNNAGGYLHKTLATTTDREFRQQMDVNLFCAVNVVNRFLSDLKKMDRALIVNICSIGALKGLAEGGAYSAAKHAVLGYTRSLRAELKNTNIAVTAINLGQTHSSSWQDSDIKAERLINSEDVAKLIVTFSGLSHQSVVEEITIQPQHGQAPPA